MAFLIRNDFYTSIESTDLDVLTSANDNVLNDAIETSKLMLESYIRDRFDVSTLFPDVLIFDINKNYITGNKVVLTAEDWLFASSYVVGDLVNDSASGLVYKCILDASGIVPTNATYFELAGVNNSIYDVILGGTGNLPSNTTYFSVGESRNPLLIRLMVDLVLYDIHSRLSPRNIPEHRIQRHDDVIKYLKAIADPRSNVNPNFPLIDYGTNRGVDISFGSTENLNSY